jgi:hypothetical protein
MSDLKRALEIESEIARSLLANIHSVLSDDEEMAITAIEGETNLLETIGVAVERISELEALEDATKARLDALKARKERFGRQAENIRTALLAAMAAVEMRKLELPHATITLKSVPPKAVIISECDVPSIYWKQPDPKLDLAAITKALKANEVVLGATLSNGNQTVQINAK